MKKILINLKDWFNLKENKQFSKDVDNLPIVIFPSLPYLYLYKDNKINEKGIQDISEYESGPHTGMVSFEHLRDFNISYALINHRENKVFDKSILKDKIIAALDSGINATVCFDGKDELEIILSIIENCKIDNNLYLAYEPNEKKSVEETIKDINYYKERLNNVKKSIIFIYGGSVSKENIAIYNSISELDGFLISRAALNIGELKSMIEIIS